MRLYHYTSRTNVNAILRDGLKPGSEVEQGERLDFVGWWKFARLENARRLWDNKGVSQTILRFF